MTRSSLPFLRKKKKKKKSKNRFQSDAAVESSAEVTAVPTAGGSGSRLRRVFGRFLEGFGCAFLWILCFLRVFLPFFLLILVLNFEGSFYFFSRVSPWAVLWFSRGFSGPLGFPMGFAWFSIVFL